MVSNNSENNSEHIDMLLRVWLGFVRKIGFEYSVSEIVEYSNTCKYYFTPCSRSKPVCFNYK